MQVPPRPAWLDDPSILQREARAELLQKLIIEMSSNTSLTPKQVVERAKEIVDNYYQ